MQWAPEISKIEIATGHELEAMGTSPASVFRATGRVLVNPSYIGKLSQDQWRFIFLHENAHLELQTSDELAVDKRARDQYLKAGLSRKQLVKALTGPLDSHNPEHVERATRQFEHAWAYDQAHPNKPKTTPKLTVMQYEDDLEHAKGRKIVGQVRARAQKLRSQAGEFVRNPVKEARDYAREAVTFARNPKRFFATGEPDGTTYNFNNFKYNYGGEEAPTDLEHAKGKKIFKRQEGGTKFGNILRKVSQVAVAAGGTMFPVLNVLPIGQGLLLKKPKEVQAAVMDANTIPEATAVVQTLAPNLSGADATRAAQLVAAAQTPEAARKASETIVAASTLQQKLTGKAARPYLIGAALLVVAVVAFFILKKKK